MAKKKRKTRKQLLKEPDEFINFSSKLVRFGTDYKKPIIIISCAVFAIFLGFSAGFYFTNKAADEAFTLLKSSQMNYERVLKEKGPEKACLELQADYENIYKNYSNEGGKLAKVMYANICYEGKKYDRSIELFTESLNDYEDNIFFRNLILSGIGHSYEQKKDYANAAKYFEMISEKSDPVMLDQALYHMGLIYKAMDEKDKSIDAFQRIMTEKKESMHLEIVKENIGG